MNVSVPPSTSAFQIIGPGGGGFNIAADPSSPGTLYASSSQSGIFKSTDEGSTWKHILNSNGLLGGSIAVAPDGTVYLACVNCVNSASLSGSGLYRSADHGNTFTDIGGAINNGIWSVTLDPINSDVIYVSDRKGGVYRSKDSANSWTVIIPDDSSCSVSNCVTTVTPDLATDGVLYLLSAATGISVSHDYGTAWSVLTGVPTGGIFFFAQSPSNPLRLYANVNTCGSNGGSDCDQFFASSDGGATWSSKSANIGGTSLTGGSSIAINPTNPDEVYLFADTFLDSSPLEWDYNVLVHSTDGGASWSIVSDPNSFLHPAVNLNLSSFQWLKAPSKLIGVMATHLWTIPFDGSPWVQSDVGLTCDFGMQVAADPNSPGTLYLAAGNSGGISKSTDGGATWKNTFNDTALAVAVDPFDSRHVLAGVLYLDFPNLLEVSTDGGITWTDGPKQTGLVGNATMIVFDPIIRGTIYLASEASGLSKSTDGGTTWSDITTGLANKGVFSLAIDPTNSQVILAGTESGMFKSADGGQSWNQVQSSQVATSVAWDANNVGVVYAAGAALLKSIDHGDSWTDITPVLSGNPYLNIVVDPRTANTLFVIASLDTVGWSPDGGQTWVWFQNVLPQTYLTVTGNFATVGGAVSLPAMSMSDPGVLYIPSMTSGVISLTMQQ